MAIRDERKSQLKAQRDEVLEMADDQPGAISMYTMGIASDVQEMIRRGMYQEAITALDSIKILIHERLAKKDEHGRHI